MDQPRELLALNEQLARRVNEAIERGLWPGDERGPVRFRCECAERQCREVLEVPIGEYEEARHNPRQFLVADGHERLEVDTVIARCSGYLVVEKAGLAGESAAASDPRA